MTAPQTPDTSATPAPADASDTAAFLDALARDAALAVLPVETDEATGAPRDESGRFTKVSDLPEDAEDTDAQAAADAATGEPKAETTEAEGQEPETETPEVEKPTPLVPVLDREPIVPLKVTIGENTIEGVPDMVVTFTGPGGKERTEPLDKVVRLAVDGIYQDAREQRIKAIESEAAQTKAQAEELATLLRERDALLTDLLADEGRYLAEKDNWDKRNTPEAQAERLRQELAQERQHRELDTIARQGEAYFTQTLTPALDLLAENLPMVAPEELIARLSLEVNRLTGRRGYLVPDQYADINRFVMDELTPWAKSLHETRSSRFAPKAETPKADPPKPTPEVAKVQAENQKLKRQVAAAVKPVGVAAPDTRRPTKPAPSTVDDALDDAVNDAVSKALGIG